MIPFNRPHLTGREFEYIQQAVEAGQLAGNGRFTQRCHAWLESSLGARRVLLTHSATGALEMAALLLELEPGDEVIMPSFTFVSTANAFVLRGATPVFVDVRPDTLNIDEGLIEAAITPRTRAIVAVHYAGVSCEMDAIVDVAARHDLVVIEDAAQALLSSYKGRALGGVGHLAALSFHETKNVISGEGGALAINDARYVERAEILWQKGTNRSAFARGTVDKYTWVDIGSSFLPGELVAAFLLAQLERAHDITAERLGLWGRYLDACAPMRALGVDLPSIPAGCVQNGHLFRVLLPSHVSRSNVLHELNLRGVNAVFHYVPLHSSPAGRRFGRAASRMDVTDHVSARLVRLPLWVGMPPEVPARIAADLMATLVAHAS